MFIIIIIIVIIIIIIIIIIIPFYSETFITSLWFSERSYKLILEVLN